MTSPTTSLGLGRRRSISVSDVDLNTDIFGVSLSKAMLLEEGRTLMPSQEIPTVLDLILCNLEFKRIEAESMLNANPDSPAVNSIRNSLSKGNLPLNLSGDSDILAGLLRRYLRELPEPLIPVSFYKTFMDTLTSTKKFKNGKDKGGLKILIDLVESKEFPRVHFHATRRILSLLKVMMDSWWNDDGDTSKVIEIFAPSILRPDNLLRQIAPKDMNTLKAACTTLITFADRIFVASNASETDVASRRQSMIRRGERTSKLHLDDDLAMSAGLGSSRSGRGITTPEKELEWKAEFRSFMQETKTEIHSLQDTVQQLQAEVGLLKSLLKQNGIELPAPKIANSGEIHGSDEFSAEYKERDLTSGSEGNENDDEVDQTKKEDADKSQVAATRKDSPKETKNNKR